MYIYDTHTHVQHSVRRVPLLCPKSAVTVISRASEQKKKEEPKNMEQPQLAPEVAESVLAMFGKRSNQPLETAGSPHLCYMLAGTKISNFTYYNI